MMRPRFLLYPIIVFCIGNAFWSCVPNTPSISKQEADSVLYLMKDFRAIGGRSTNNSLPWVMEMAFQEDQSREVIEQAFLDFLNDEASVEAKNEVLFHLGPIATQNSEDTLFKMLMMEAHFDAALRAISYLPGKEADSRLLSILNQADNRQSNAIISTLGHRRNPEVVKPLYELSGNSDHLYHAILAAIGNIPSQEAAELLSDLMNKQEEEQKWETADHLVQLADALTEKGLDASRYYKEVFSVEAPKEIVYGAIRGLIASDSSPIDLLTEVFNAGNNELIAYVIPVIRALQDVPDEAFISNGFEKLDSENRANFLLALADRGVKSVKARAIEAVNSEHKYARIAGLKSLNRIGDEADILLLAKLASESKRLEKELARKALYRIKGTSFDQSILKNLQQSEGAAKEELVLAIGQRKIMDGEVALLNLVPDVELTLNVAALRSLSAIGTSQAIEQLIRKSIHLSRSSERRQLIRTLTILIERSVDLDGRGSTSIITALDTVNLYQRVILIEILGNVAEEGTLDVLLSYLSSADQEVKRASITALSDWPTGQPLDELVLFFKGSNDKEDRVLVLSGIERMIDRAPNLNNDERAEQLTSLLGEANGDDERKILLSGMGKTGSLITFEAAIELLAYEGLVLEAQAAILQNISNMERDATTDEFRQYLEAAQKKSSNDDFKRELEKWISNSS